MLQKALINLLSWALPVHCVLCNRRTEKSRPNLCVECENDLPWLQNVCIRCGLPLVAENNGLTCGQCLQRPPGYQQLRALFRYDTPINNMILQLKFHKKLIYAHLLGELLATRCIAHYTTTKTPTILLPVPLHPRRLRERGFNQAIEIARPVAKRLQIPIGYSHTKRLKYTQAQMELPLEERLQNVKHAFSANAALKGMHVAVIDDVITSGHTINAFVAALHAAGVAQVDVWGIARTLK